LSRSRSTTIVFAVIEALVAEGKTSFRPGDVNSALRDKGEPMGTWEVRAEFSRLEEQGSIACDAVSGNWQMLSSDALKDAG